MALFKKKTTLVHHITYMGIMAAINLIFILLATFVPPLMFILILLLPFASTVVAYYCLKRYYIIYAVATVGLCFLCSFNIGDTIFYVVPAIASGFVLGVFLEQKIHPFWMLLSCTVINAALTYAFIPLVNLISKTDIVLSLLTIFNLQDFLYKTELVYLFIFFLCISFYFGAFLLVDLIFSKKLLIYILSGVLVLAMIFVFAIFYKSLKEPYGIELSVIFPLALGVVSFLKNILFKYPVNI